MSPGLYLLGLDGSLVAMAERPYGTEADLQKLIEDFPHLLSGDEVVGEVERRWLLVAREAGLASDETGGSRWSVDHLFIDANAIPTLVEVKRSSDTRIRREVVGQMLDYAANGADYWPIEKLRARFEATCNEKGISPDEVLSGLLGEQGDVEKFWSDVKTNLEAGRIRLVFVADFIPPELQRIVEFLNEQMSNAEVLAIEIRQYVGGDQRTLAPRVIGQTSAAQRAKATGRPSRTWDESSFFGDLEARHGTEAVRVARELYDWARRQRLRIKWGTGSSDGSFSAIFDHAGAPYYTFVIYTYGKVELQFQHMTRPPFDDYSQRLEFLRRVNETPGIAISEDALNKRPAIDLKLLARDPSAVSTLLAAFEWFLDRARS